eukprot:CAMPEP_0167773384 /NCGR_PEP_ID=MMETSP0111_2-20121227/1387_1 /TAXON_ID=91324 /ORGANISM="Lotharella globosa, Strain CCCM811" /LENGTH=669 /DNA_ID=CAMNT_0007663009 /DNA_START=3961 /DNA_END=5970 /DNA_ORIENTATION=+
MAMRPSASKHHSPPPLPSPFSTTPRHHSVGPRPLVKKRKSINAGVLPRQKRAKGQGVAGREKKGPGAVKCERRSATLADIPGCPVFRPSDQEFQDFHEYVRSIHHEAKKHGICKIIPPNTWLERHRPKFRIPAKKFGYKRQTFHRWNNGSQVSSIESEVPISYKDFLKAAKSSAKSGEYKALGKNAEASAADIEREYWQWLETPRPKPAEVLYASDGALSIFPEPKKKKSRTKSSTTSLATKNCKKGREDDDISARTEEKEAEKEAEESQWNLKAISRLPKGLLRFVEKDVPGVTEPYSYIGTRFSTFCWHVEDDNLYSLSFLHGGAPKTWYGVPSTAARLVEDVYASVFPTLGKNGHGLAKKTSMFCPTKLAEKGVPVYRCVQNKGEFVITFPRAYHGGFNNGINFAEAVNFADESWLRYGAKADKHRRNSSTPLSQRTAPVVPFEEIALQATLDTLRDFKSSDPRGSFQRSLGGAPGTIAARIRKRRKAFKGLCDRDDCARDRFLDRCPSMRQKAWGKWLAQDEAYCYTCKSFLSLTMVAVRPSRRNSKLHYQNPRPRAPAPITFLCLGCASRYPRERNKDNKTITLASPELNLGSEPESEPGLLGSEEEAKVDGVCLSRFSLSELRDKTREMVECENAGDLADNRTIASMKIEAGESQTTPELELM